MIIEPVLYMQTDSRWKNVPYATGSNDRVGKELATIGNSGCGPSCMAMVITTLTGQTVTPQDTCGWALANNYKATNQGTYYSYFQPQGAVYDISVVQQPGANTYKSNTPAAYNLRTRMLTVSHDGDWVICVMGPSRWTSSGHFVLLWYTDDDDYVHIKDPYNTAKNYSYCHKSEFLPYVKYFWHVDVRGYLENHRGDDEVITNKPIKIFGEDFNADTIVKEERNFVTPKVLNNVGLNVGNDGGKAVITMPGVKVNNKSYDGFYCNGRAFIALEDYEKSLGSDVGWDGKSILVIRKK